MERINYWTNRSKARRASRRTLLKGAGAAGVGAIGLWTVGCGGDDDEGDGDPTSQAGTPSPSATPTPQSTVKRGGELTVRRSSNMAFWDPQRASGGFDPPITDLYAARLLDLAATGEIQGYLADSYEQPAADSVTLKLRTDVLFGDDTPFNAEAVKYTFERGQDKELNAPVRPALSAISKIETPDESTVVLTLTGPNGAFLETLTGRAGVMISPTAHDTLGDDRFNESPVGAGPYKAEKIVQDGESRFVKVASWPFLGLDGGQLPYLDAVKVSVIPEDAVSLAALSAGDIDLDYVVDPLNLQRVESDPNTVAHILEGARFLAAEFVTNQAPTDILAFRQAVNHAIDREESNQALAAGLGLPGTGPLTPLNWAYDPDVTGFDYNPDKAKQLLAQAGFPDGVEVKCATYAIEQATLLQAQLERVGIRLVVDNLELAVYQEQFRSKGEYKIGTAGGPVPTGDPYEFFLTRYGSKGKYNPGEPSNPEWDELIAQSVATLDLEERKSIYSQLQRMDNEQAYRAWILTTPRIMGSRKSIQNLSWMGYNPDLRHVFIDA